MKVWIGGEVESDIGKDFANARNKIEQVINASIGQTNYGHGIAELSFIAMIFGRHCPPDYQEIKKYQERRKNFEFRLNLNYEKFKESSNLGREVLIFEGLLKTLVHMDSMKVRDVDVEKLRIDLEQLGRRHHWL